MSKDLTNNNHLPPKELAKHLRQPKGEDGKQVGMMMNHGNKHICLNSYKVLNPTIGDHILEIGMGNGFFIKELLSSVTSLKYTGLDFSATMIEEASHINQELVKSGVVSFRNSSIEKLPFEDNSFDCICTTNTIYFWPEPDKNTKELFRVLRDGGKLLIAYRSRDMMSQLEVAKYGFSMYNPTEVEELVVKSGFKRIKTERIKEPKFDFNGTEFELEGYYTTGEKVNSKSLHQ